MKALKCVLAVALVLVIAGGAMAQDAEKKGKAARKDAARKAPAPSARFLADIELTPEQKEKVAELDKEFAPKFAEQAKAQRELLTPEQLKAQQDAQKAARESGAKGQELQKQIAAALKLSPEQQEKQAELRKKGAELNQAYLEKVSALLTPAQKEKLPKLGTRGAGAAKKAAAKKKPGDGSKKPGADAPKKPKSDDAK